MDHLPLPMSLTCPIGLVRFEYYTPTQKFTRIWRVGAYLFSALQLIQVDQLISYPHFYSSKIQVYQVHFLYSLAPLSHILSADQGHHQRRHLSRYLHRLSVNVTLTAPPLSCWHTVGAFMEIREDIAGHVVHIKTCNPSGQDPGNSGQF